MSETYTDRTKNSKHYKSYLKGITKTKVYRICYLNRNNLKKNSTGNKTINIVKIKEEREMVLKCT